MNKRITEAFAKGKAFIPFVTCGDPSLDVTEKIVYAMEEAGADLIELGIPFSDPTAEGPVIQGANLRALSGGVTTDKVFDMVEKIRKNSSIPMVFMTYANVVFSYGIERFCKRAAEVGMDGMILPDVPRKRRVRIRCREVWSGSDLSDRTDLPRENLHDRKRGRRICLLRILPRSYRHAKPDHHRHRSHGGTRQSPERHPMCRRLRNLQPRAGQENGLPGRRRHRGFCHCQTL